MNSAECTVQVNGEAGKYRFLNLVGFGEQAAMYSGKVLIFPATIPQAAAMARSLLELGIEAFTCASSMRSVSEEYEFLAERMHYLPYISADNFVEELSELVEKEAIGSIYTVHPGVWMRLQRDVLRALESQHGVSLRLCQSSPFEAVLAPYRDSYRTASSLRVDDDGNGTELSEHELAGLLLHYQQVPGESDLGKLKGFLEIFPQLPDGDVVELGSYLGKSSYALARLSQRYSLGPVICVDPWDYQGTAEQGHAAQALREANEWMDSDLAKRAFCATMSGFPVGSVNYIQHNSDAAYEIYRSEHEVFTPEFGRTEFEGSIALLHIDGNHSFEQARRDLLNWTPLVSKGGWIILDDYDWPFGDGPKRAADEFMLVNQSKLACSKIVDGALYLQVR